MCASSTGRGRLIVVCGLPGAGKTTHATRVASDIDGVRLCADEWMSRLGISLWDSQMRERVEHLQWDLARQLLALGQAVVIGWGTWSRAEREVLREEARGLGALVELHYVHATLDVLDARVSSRHAEDPPITLAQLRAWADQFDVPDDNETARWDRFEMIGPDATT